MNAKAYACMVMPTCILLLIDTHIICNVCQLLELLSFWSQVHQLISVLLGFIGVHPVFGNLALNQPNQRLHMNSSASSVSSSGESSGHSASGPKRKRSWSRAVFSNLQRKGLEKRFNVQKYVTKPDRRQLAALLGLTDAQVSPILYACIISDKSWALLYALKCISRTSILKHILHWNYQW